MTTQPGLRPEPNREKRNNHRLPSPGYARNPNQNEEKKKNEKPQISVEVIRDLFEASKKIVSQLKPDPTAEREPARRLWACN